MSVFDDVTVDWQGQTRTVPASRVLGLIARVEDHVTLPELGRFAERESIPMARLAQAWCAALQYAGHRATADDVYEALLSQGSERIVNAVQALMTIMLPPSMTKPAKEVADAKPGNGEVMAGSSKPRTKR